MTSSLTAQEAINLLALTPLAIEERFFRRTYVVQRHLELENTEPQSSAILHLATPD
ncbi:MAG: hypothetical protein M3440_02035 [Chloroflexota bacterium]|nr:hypothetical protein [Chloroflexota bacterium]